MARLIYEDDNGNQLSVDAVDLASDTNIRCTAKKFDGIMQTGLDWDQSLAAHAAPILAHLKGNLEAIINPSQS